MVTVISVDVLFVIVIVLTLEGFEIYILIWPEDVIVNCVLLIVIPKFCGPLTLIHIGLLFAFVNFIVGFPIDSNVLELLYKEITVNAKLLTEVLIDLPFIEKLFTFATIV